MKEVAVGKLFNLTLIIKNLKVRFDLVNQKWVPNFNSSYIENFDSIAIIPSIYEGKV